MAGIVSFAYQNVFRRTSTFVATAVLAAFFFERGVDVITDNVFDNYNRGKQWKDIKKTLEK